MLHVMSTGRVREKSGSRGVLRYLLDDWRETTMPVNVVLIEHPLGLCLVDAGQTEQAAHAGYFPLWYPFFHLARFELDRSQEAEAQLQAMGVAISEVRWVVLTHMHTDHVGGIGAFQGAEVVVSEAEWMPAQGIRGRLRGYLPQKWPCGLRVSPVRFDGPAVGPFDASHDIAGDGRLVMVPLPGHTPGHAGLLSTLENGARVLCAGDAAHDAAEFARALPAVSRWCHDEGVAVLLTHDDAAAATSRAARARATPSRAAPIAARYIATCDASE